MLANEKKLSKNVGQVAKIFYQMFRVLPLFRGGISIFGDTGLYKILRSRLREIVHQESQDTGIRFLHFLGFVQDY